MKRTVSLRKNKDFLRLYRSAEFYVGKIMVIYVKPNKSDGNRLGITTVRNFGNSVFRNRMRRIIKENYRLMEDQLAVGWDIVFSARKNQNGKISAYNEVEKEMRYLFRKTGLLK